MPRLFPTFCAGLWVVAGVSVISADEPDALPPLDGSSTVARLMVRLGDDDPLIRRDATQRLINLGDQARPALRKAIAGASPQVRSEIDQVLLHVPWTRPGEAEEVAQALAGYAEKDAEARCMQIEGTIAPLGTAASAALLRIVLNDPSPAVRWSAADALRLTLDEGTLARQVIDAAEDKEGPAYLPAKENAPLLAIAGWALRLSDPKRAEVLFNGAVQIESGYPSAFRSQSDFAFEWLSDRMAMKKDYAAMVRLLREQAARTEWNPDALPASVAKLFAVQGEYGPLPGFAADLRGYQDYIGYPEVVYSMGRMLRRHDHPALAGLVGSIAIAMNGWSAESHYTTGVFLAQQHWDADAVREMQWCISLSNGRNYLAYFILSELAEQRDDDLACAQALDQGLKQMHAQGQMMQGTFADEYAAEAEWHYLRAYRLVKDQVKTAEHLERLLQMDQDKQILQKDPGMAADIVPALQDAKRNDEADRIFDSAYAALLEKVTATPADPMPKNNLAWLCACSGKKLDEAVKYADMAVAQDQEDSACLDTQAEAYFRVGRVKEALEIEKRALAFKPEDAYMARQVERFAAAAR
jgi:tetratricopeptide (TPR) repeat protein